MTCKLCDAEAVVRVINPFGVNNLCAVHALATELRCGPRCRTAMTTEELAERAWRQVVSGLRDANREGPTADPPLPGPAPAMEIHW